MFYTSALGTGMSEISFEFGSSMITAAQLRAARALLGIDQQTLADLAGVSMPTIQRMEASQGNVRGVIDTLIKVVDALNAAGIELLGDNAKSEGGGRGVRFREAAVNHHVATMSPSRTKKGRALVRS
jgi:transcriptional regulator with XRE-family HTH domain